MNTDTPRIPLAVFRKMARALSADELSKLPPEKLPDQIPFEFIESLEPESAKAVDELILARQMALMEQQRLRREALGADVAGAISFAQRAEHETAAGELRRKLVRFLNRLQASGKRLSLSQALDHLESLEAHRELIGRVQDEYDQLLQARKLLRDTLFRPHDFKSLVEDAEARLARQGQALCDLLGRYHGERCKLCLFIMQSHHKRLHRREDLRREITQRLDWLTTARENGAPAPEKQEGRRIHKEVRALFRRMREQDGVIDETDFTYWLDIIVDFSLYRRHDTRYEALVDKSAQVLAELMRHYFVNAGQEAAEASGEQAFEQGGSQFLRGYLDRKQPALQRQACVPASDRLYAINRLKRILGR